jgi:hypothetical protein
MLFWSLWLIALDTWTRPVTVQVTVRVPATIYDFEAERAKRRKA